MTWVTVSELLEKNHISRNKVQEVKEKLRAVPLVRQRGTTQFEAKSANVVFQEWLEGYRKKAKKKGAIGKARPFHTRRAAAKGKNGRSAQLELPLFESRATTEELLTKIIQRLDRLIAIWSTKP
jgi:hypothetical protein